MNRNVAHMKLTGLIRNKKFVLGAVLTLKYHGCKDTLIKVIKYKKSLIF